MIDDIRSLGDQIRQALQNISSKEALETFRLRHLVRKGTLAELTERLREVPKEDKPNVGRVLNELKKFVEEKFEGLREHFDQAEGQTPTIDTTLPARHNISRGSFHPVRQTIDDFVEIFKSMGFSVAEGQDIEDDFHNFEALNFAPDHPARDMQDTFFLDGDGQLSDRLLLRTHTSNTQIRLMETMAPPIRSIMPGRVYRNEDISARSLAEFHQIEGLVIDKDVTFADLKGTIITFAKRMYGDSAEFRFRPSFFPFTEPSAEIDMTCFLCSGKGCRVCKQSGWLEICGCGMVHPNVLQKCGIDPEVYSGYAFGFGIERVAMLRTGIDDIRLFYENDVRVLRQFE